MCTMESRIKGRLLCGLGLFRAPSRQDVLVMVMALAYECECIHLRGSVLGLNYFRKLQLKCGHTCLMRNIVGRKWRTRRRSPRRVDISQKNGLHFV